MINCNGEMKRNQKGEMKKKKKEIYFILFEYIIKMGEKYNFSIE